MNFKTSHILIVIICMLLFSCAMENRSSKATDEFISEPIKEKRTEILNDNDSDGILDDVDDYKIDLEVSPEYNYNGSSFRYTAPSLNTQPLIKEKLQDFYDLIVLQNQHPEFSKEVVAQLKTFTNDSLQLYTSKNTKTIQNIRQISNVKLIDSVTTKIKYAYDIMSDRNRKTDTIWAIISSKTIIVDGETLVSRKVKFSKY